MKFAAGLVADVKAKLKTATVRYDDEKGIGEGDVLKLKTPDGEPFGRATVTSTQVCELRDAPRVVQQLGGQHGASGAYQLGKSMNDHYDATIFLTTMVKVIVFEIDGE